MSATFMLEAVASLGVALVRLVNVVYLMIDSIVAQEEILARDLVMCLGLP